LDQLIERLNYKGIRERRLQESLRKVKDILKLKKTRKPKNSDFQMTSEKTEGEAAQKTEEKTDEPIKA
jgi:uncharacterized protein YktA (UPF0223 family)